LLLSVLYPALPGDDVHNMATTTVKSSLPAGLLPVVIAFLLMTTPALYVTCYPVKPGATAYACASTSCYSLGTIPAGTEVFIACVAIGDVINGDSQWDYVGYSSNGFFVGYVNDFYVNCGGVLCPGPGCL
jgi:hypothetical protein